MTRVNKPIDARRDVAERRILSHGATPEQWAVEVAQPVEGVWTTTLYVGVQGFQITNDRGEDAERHCTSMGRMFVKALEVLLHAETRPLRQAILTANDAIFDSRVDDAFEVLQAAIREWVEPTPAVGLSGAFSEDLYNEDGSEVTAEQARERNPETTEVPNKETR